MNCSISTVEDAWCKVCTKTVETVNLTVDLLICCLGVSHQLFVVTQLGH